MQVIATNHTGLTVENIDRAVAFFTDALGFAVRWPQSPSPGFMEEVTGVAQPHVRVAVVTCPGHAIELFQYYSPEARQTVEPRPCDVGFAHLAF